LAAGSALVGALEEAWLAIRRRHPEVPDAEFFDRANAPYMTHGRQSAAQVVAAALAAVDGSSPIVVPAR
jgi:hypothetical protein